MSMQCQILSGKRGLIFGVLNEQSLAYAVARHCLDAGAKIVLTNTSAALELGTVSKVASDWGVPLIACDATRKEELNRLLSEAQERLGGKIDFILHAVAQSQNLRRHKSYEEVNYDYFLKTIDISALSFHKLLQASLEQDAMAAGGSVVTLTYMASERYFEGYNDMADAKALLESIVRQMGAVYGKHNGVRVNAICQSAVPTKAGGQWQEMEYFYQYANELSPLGSSGAEDCADLCVALFSDLTRKLTMQTLYNDGGFSRTMMTGELMQTYKYGFDNVPKKSPLAHSGQAKHTESNEK